MHFLANSKWYIWGRIQAQVCRTVICFLRSAGTGPVTQKPEFLVKDIIKPSAETSLDPIQRKPWGGVAFLDAWEHLNRVRYGLFYRITTYCFGHKKYRRIGQRIIKWFRKTILNKSNR